MYKKVRSHLLGDQRNAGYIRVYYNNVPNPGTEKLNGPIYELLKAKKYHKAVNEIKADAAVMDLVKQDSEAANAYGVALYFVALDNKDEAAEREAIGLLQKAAAQGKLFEKELHKGDSNHA